jgi:uncharacterized membrane protein (DUF485 family)
VLRAAHALFHFPRWYSCVAFHALLNLTRCLLRTASHAFYALLYRHCFSRAAPLHTRCSTRATFHVLLSTRCDPRCICAAFLAQLCFLALLLTRCNPAFHALLLRTLALTHTHPVYVLLFLRSFVFWCCFSHAATHAFHALLLRLHSLTHTNTTHRQLHARARYLILADADSGTITLGAAVGRSGIPFRVSPKPAHFCTHCMHAERCVERSTLIKCMAKLTASH